MKLESNRITFDRLAKLCGVRSMDEFENDLYSNCEFSYSYAYSEALKEGKSEEEAEERAQIVESDEMGECIRKYHAAVVEISEDILGNHSLVLEPVGDRKHPNAMAFEFRIRPAKREGWKNAWLAALTVIRQTLNGAGPFYFATNKELMDSGPYTARQAVLTHVGWAFRQWDVFGDPSLQSRIERGMR